MAWEGSRIGGGARSDRVPVRAQSAGAGYDDATRILLEASDREVRGLTVEPGQLAVAESCVGLWERCLASATIKPDSAELAGVTPGVLALAGRSLATGGNALFQIEVADSMVYADACILLGPSRRLPDGGEAVLSHDERAAIDGHARSARR